MLAYVTMWGSYISLLAQRSYHETRRDASTQPHTRQRHRNALDLDTSLLQFVTAYMCHPLMLDYRSSLLLLAVHPPTTTPLKLP